MDQLSILKNHTTYILGPPHRGKIFFHIDCPPLIGEKSFFIYIGLSPPLEHRKMGKRVYNIYQDLELQQDFDLDAAGKSPLASEQSGLGGYSLGAEIYRGA